MRLILIVGITALNLGQGCSTSEPAPRVGPQARVMDSEYDPGITPDLKRICSFCWGTGTQRNPTAVCGLCAGTGSVHRAPAPDKKSPGRVVER